MEYPKIIDLEANCHESLLNTKYEFIGVSEHVGYHAGQGHYIAHAYRDGAYYKFDDEKYERVSE